MWKSTALFISQVGWEKMLAKIQKDISFQAAIQLHGIVEIYKSARFFLMMFGAIKLLFVMPCFYNRLYFCLVSIVDCNY